MHPPTRCPVCGDTSITALKHPKTFKVASKQTTAYRCSRHHAFYAVPREVEQATRLRGESRTGRAVADEAIKRARELRGERISKLASFTMGIEPINTGEAIQQAREAVRKSKETRSKTRGNRTLSKEIVEQVTQSLNRAKHKRQERPHRAHPK